MNEKSWIGAASVAAGRDAGPEAMVTPTGLRESYNGKGLRCKTPLDPVKAHQELARRSGKRPAALPPPKMRNAAPVGAGNGGSAFKAANLGLDDNRTHADLQADRLRRVAHVSEPVARVLAFACYGRATG